jgi:hypothetical protein
MYNHILHDCTYMDLSISQMDILSHMFIFGIISFWTELDAVVTFSLSIEYIHDLS